MAQAFLVIFGVLSVAGLLFAAEVRFHNRPQTKHPDVLFALGRLLDHPRTEMLPLRVIFEANLGHIEGQRIAATSEVERAWSPWGTKRYLIKVSPEVHDVARMVQWEAVHRCLRHHETGSFGPTFIRPGEHIEYDRVMTEVAITRG